MDSVTTTPHARLWGHLKWAFAVTAGLHLVALGRVLFRPLQARRLIFSDPLTSAKSNGNLASRRHKVFEEIRSPRCSWKLIKLYDVVASNTLRPIFPPPPADSLIRVFLFQECIEIACQIYQAGKIALSRNGQCVHCGSMDQPRNGGYEGMIFLNCASTPLIHWLVPESANKPLQRLLSVTVSTFLHSLVIPLVIFMPYVHAVDPTIQYFPGDLLWDDVWFVQALRENEYMLPTEAASTKPVCSIGRKRRDCADKVRNSSKKNQTKTSPFSDSPLASRKNSSLYP